MVLIGSNWYIKRRFSRQDFKNLKWSKNKEYHVLGRNQDVLFISYLKLPAVAKLREDIKSPHNVILLLLHGRKEKEKQFLKLPQ